MRVSFPWLSVWVLLVGPFAVQAAALGQNPVGCCRSGSVPAQAPALRYSRLEALLATADGTLSVSRQDRDRARQVVPFAMDVHLVKPASAGLPMAIIGSDGERVWVIEVERKLAQARSIGRRIYPDDQARVAVQRAVDGGQVLFAYGPPRVGAGEPTPERVGHSGPEVYHVLVRSHEDLYQVRLDGSEHPSVRRLGSLRK